MEIIETIRPHLPVILGLVLPVILGLLLGGQARLDTFVRETVAAVYRVAIHSADVLGAEGIAWLRGEAGITYRKALAAEAYRHLPSRIGGLPVGIIKVYLTEERFCQLIEVAFQEVVKLADQLEGPAERPTA